MVRVFLDTCCIPRINKLSNERSKSVWDAIEFFLKKEIPIYVSDRSHEDIFGEDLKKNRPEAWDRYSAFRSMGHLPTIERESGADFNELDIEIFNLFFNREDVNEDNILQNYQRLSSNDRNDYRILLDAIANTRKITYILTLNSNDFSVKKEDKINKLLEREDLKIRFLNPHNDNLEQILKTNMESGLLN